MSPLPIHGLDETGQVTDTFYAVFVLLRRRGRRVGDIEPCWHLVAMLDTEAAARTEATRRIYRNAEEDVAIARVGGTASVDPTKLASLRAESREMNGDGGAR